MTGYAEGKQDDPADTKDRLLRVGSKYQATAPSVADGDNVYLLVDAAGGPHDEGAAAHDAAATGNPFGIGGVHRTALPGVAAADIVDLLMSAEGRARVEEYLVQQSRIGNLKNTFAASSAATANSEATYLTWTVTSGKTGYLSACTITVNSHASETRHLFRLKSNGTIIEQFTVGQGSRVQQIIFPVPHKLAAGLAFTITEEQQTNNDSRRSEEHNGSAGHWEAEEHNRRDRHPARYGG